MARLRTIKPGFFENEELAECSPYARLMFIGLWCHADRRGVLSDRPKKLKIAILPADDVSGESLLKELHDHELILRYEVDGQKCILIPNFQKHQSPHQHEPQNDLPVPESMIHVSYKHGASTVGVRVKSEARPPLTLTLKKDISNDISKEPIERQTKLDPAWRPDDKLIQYAKEQGITDVEKTILDFVDYYVSTGKRFTQWYRVWQKWCRNQYSKSNGHSRSKIPTYTVDTQAY